MVGTWKFKHHIIYPPFILPGTSRTQFHQHFQGLQVEGKVDIQWISACQLLISKNGNTQKEMGKPLQLVS
jgi:hypothetical protein